MPLISTFDLARGEVLTQRFEELVVREGLTERRSRSVACEPTSLEVLRSFGDVVHATEGSQGAGVLLRVAELVVALRVRSGTASILVAGHAAGAVEDVCAALASSLRAEPREDDTVPMTFWAETRLGAISPRRRIPAQRWEQLEGNYPAVLRPQLGELLAATEPGEGGLLLWHGPPGTGKTHALRGLARAWASWCDVHVITDADVFLGGQAGYLLSSLLRTDEDDSELERARLIVLEDAGELLAADARAVTGQALSRLLNLTDGVLGEGLRTMVLVTTNEPLQRLHPAVVRPGRTWMELEFGAFPAGDARAWLEARGCDAPGHGELTLAELYALAAGRTVAARGAPVGFAAA